LGVGSPGPKEALLIQLEVLSETITVPPLAKQAIIEGLNFLSKRQYPELGRLLNISTQHAQEIARFISENLNPYPANGAWGDIRQGSKKNTNVYTHPDVIIGLLTDSPDSPLVVEIVSPFAGLIQVNPMFRSSLSQAPPNKADQWKSDLDRAELLVKCLQQRTNTIVRLMTRITTRQREFILNGDRHLKPVTRASLAGALGVHESTISRAVASKTVQLPNGHIVPLSKFFDRSLHIRSALKQIVLHETKPLSDNEIANILKEEGFEVARRTVAKYRAMEGILPSHLRQNHTVLEAA
jgi:RNA polymerase sigma-54 factor